MATRNSNTRTRNSNTRTRKAKKLALLFDEESTGITSMFVTDVTGVLTELQSPEKQEKEDTYEFDGQTRPTAWRAVIVTADGSTVYWNWPGRIDEDGDNMPGIKIIARGYRVNDLLNTGLVARFYRDPKTNRSSITPIETAPQQSTRRADVTSGHKAPWGDLS